MRIRKKFLFVLFFLVIFCGTTLAAENKIPAPVIKSVVANRDHSVTVKWKKVQLASSYSLYYRKTGSQKWILIASGIKSTSYRHIQDDSCPLEAGLSYDYTVKSVKSGKTGKYNTAGVRVVPYTDGNVTDGWERDGDHVYYRVLGKRISGWRKINGKHYWFETKTNRLSTNTIVGSGKDQYFVDDTGIRVTDPVIRSAVSFVRKYAASSKNRLGKLKACYRYIVYKCHYRSSDDEESIRKMPSYAQYMFQMHMGNCYRGAAALTYAAKVLGYETRMGVGGVTAYADRSLSTHGWTEVKIKGKWYICDTSMQRYHPDTDLFMVPRKEYPYRIRIDDTYDLTVQNGKVAWR